MGSAPLNDPEYETYEWKYGFEPSRPAGAGTCTIGDHWSEDNETVRDLAVEWSADGLSHTDYNAACHEEGATITRDTSGRVKRRDWPDCAPFGDGLCEYQYDEQGRFLEGECWFTPDQMRFGTPHGSYLGTAGLF